MRNVPPENSIPGAGHRFMGIPTFRINQTAMEAKKKYVLIVAGTRKIFESAKQYVYTEIGREVIALEGRGYSVEILTGGSGDVDNVGNRYALDNKIEVHTFVADWRKFDKAAGPIRNEYMARNANGLIAFWDGKSPGTKDMITRAEKFGLETKIFEL
jgi:hypothetical protein